MERERMETPNLLSRLANTRLALPPAVEAWAARRWRASQGAPSDVVVVEGSETGLRLTRVTRARGAAPRVRSAHRSIGSDLLPDARDLAERRALGSMVAELHVAGRPAIASLAGPDIVVRRLSMPAMRPADLRSAIELECRRHVNYPLAEAEIAYEILGRRGPGREESVLVVIAPRRRVADRRALLLAAGLRPWSITVPAVGLRADLERRGALDPAEVVAYLDVGSESSQIVVLKGHDIRFSRDLAFGLHSMAGALRQIVVPGVGTVERSTEAAEDLLRSSGIPLGADEVDFADGVPLSAVSVMLRPTLERLVRELWNSFDYCHEQFLGEAVTSVVLLGPGARLRNLGRYLSGVLKMPVVAADPSKEGAGAVAESSQPDAASEDVRLASISRDTLNFLGRSPEGFVAAAVEMVPSPVVAAAAAILVLSIAAPAEVQNAKARARVASLRGDLQALATQSAAVAQFRAAREEEARLQALVGRLTGSQVVWSSVLRDLSHRIGADVRLTNVEVVDPAAPSGAPGAAPANPAPTAARSVRLSGLLRSSSGAGGVPTERVLAELLQSLGASPVFDQVRLDGCERVAPELSTFTLTARLMERAGS
jgi:type IV pilus assembly protein PilM